MVLRGLLWWKSQKVRRCNVIGLVYGNNLTGKKNKKHGKKPWCPVPILHDAPKISCHSSNSSHNLPCNPCKSSTFGSNFMGFSWLMFIGCGEAGKWESVNIMAVQQLLTMAWHSPFIKYSQLDSKSSGIHIHNRGKCGTPLRILWKVGLGSLAGLTCFFLSNNLVIQKVINIYSWSPP